MAFPRRMLVSLRVAQPDDVYLITLTTQIGRVQRTPELHRLLQRMAQQGQLKLPAGFVHVQHALGVAGAQHPAQDVLAESCARPDRRHEVCQRRTARIAEGRESAWPPAVLERVGARATGTGAGACGDRAVCRWARRRRPDGPPRLEAASGAMPAQECHASIQKPRLFLSFPCSSPPTVHHSHAASVGLV